MSRTSRATISPCQLPPPSSPSPALPQFQRLARSKLFSNPVSISLIVAVTLGRGAGCSRGDRDGIALFGDSDGGGIAVFSDGDRVALLCHCYALGDCRSWCGHGHGGAWSGLGLGLGLDLGDGCWVAGSGGDHRLGLCRRLGDG